MTSLTIRILAALITFTIGVAVAGLWLMRWTDPVICRLPTTPPPAQSGAPASRLEMVFVLDTTGSMGGLIDGAKQRIWGIVNEVTQTSPSPSVRIGLVAYRDHGDAYVTQVLPLTDDLDKVYTRLMDYKADGGGDEPEDVRSALADGVNKAGWSPASPDLSQIIFLVGDAPPHDDYVKEVDTLTSAAQAVQKGMIVNTIQCGHASDTKRAWQAIAQRGHGQYFAIAENGGVQTIKTPYDDQLGQLATELGQTFTAYGFGGRADAEQRRVETAQAEARVESGVMNDAPATAKAERAVNKAIYSKAYVGDLLQDIENGSVKLENVKTEDLPQDLQALSPSERQQEIEKRLAHRRDLRAQILQVSKQRDAYIAAERKKSSSSGDGFDTVVAKTLKEQMTRKAAK